MAAAGIPLARITDLVHGSTVATNAVLERKGGLTAFVTTAGFRDLLLIQRQDRPKIYHLSYQKPVAVVERRDVDRESRNGCSRTARSRLRSIRSPPPQRIEAALSARPFKAVAICLLNAYANPAHERAVADLIRARFPDLYVSCSHEISREFREYERASTTALSAYVQPIIDSYLGRFEDAACQRTVSRAVSASCSRTAGACLQARSGATPSPRCSPARPPASWVRSARSALRIATT